MLFAARPRRAFKADARPAKAQTAARPMRPPAVAAQAFSVSDPFGRPTVCRQPLRLKLPACSALSPRPSTVMAKAGAWQGFCQKLFGGLNSVWLQSIRRLNKRISALPARHFSVSLAGVDLSADRKNAAFFINYANASFWSRQIRLFCGPPCSFVNRVDAVPSVNRLAVPFM